MSDKEEIEIKSKEETPQETKDDKKTRELTVRRESPFSLFQEMDRWFDDIFDDFLWPFNRRRRNPFKLVVRDIEPIFRTPLTNIHETEEHFNITAELPGINKGDIELTIQDGKLEIKGESKEEKSEEVEGESVRREFRSSKYYRVFNLPEYIEEDNIEANLEKGMLTIKIPKIKPSEPVRKKIEVQS
ncbi:MAG: Hsp20/alpha crystallin family protein [Candidatus Lokiarchaeota archaeon]|nr:Hsp20/alpha crystallin family protein [Candidatus Lokiarchaeota archaeon]